MHASVKVVALQLSRRTAWRGGEKICEEYNVGVYKIRTCCWLGCLALVGDRSYTAQPGRTHGTEADTRRVKRSATRGTCLHLETVTFTK